MSLRAALVLAFAIALAACAGEPILHGLDEPRANEVLVALDDAGIAAEKARDDAGDDRWMVSVPAREVSRAHRVLADRALPRARPAGFREVFAKGSMVPTPTEEHARYLHALGGELARSIEVVDGVLAARVHLGLPQPDPLRAADRATPRAAALVRCRPGLCDSVRALEGGIRALVAGAADGLDPSSVSIVIAEASPSDPSPLPAPRRRSAVLFALAAAAGAGALALVAVSVRSRVRRELPARS
jgi:type III secretion protein J